MAGDVAHRDLFLIIASHMLSAFLQNLHGIFEATSQGGLDLDWNAFKAHNSIGFPAQVRCKHCLENLLPYYLGFCSRISGLGVLKKHCQSRSSWRLALASAWDLHA
jgi:hypothetical protein